MFVRSGRSPGFCFMALLALLPAACRRDALPSGNGGSSAASPETATTPEIRPVYPYSVIPGGVRSVAELEWAVAFDSVVLEHYRDFRFARAHFVTNAVTRRVYVSYRSGRKIYWTTRRVRVPHGEMLISDGVYEIRSRCGNRISQSPQLPTAAEASEPPLETLDVPTPEFVLRPNPLAAEIPSLPRLWDIIANEERPSPAPVATPEPSTAALVFLSLGLLALVRHFRK